jgi:hypothetical protein
MDIMEVEIKMQKYVKDCMDGFKDGDKARFLECILRGIIKHQGEKKVVTTATKVFIGLVKQNDAQTWITVRDLVKAGSPHSAIGGKGGLWPWVNAKVIEKKDDKREFRINAAYYNDFLNVLPPLL